MRITLTDHDFPNLDGSIRPTIDGPLKRAFVAVLNSIAACPDLTHCKPMLNPADYPEIGFPSPGATIPVEVYWAGSRDVFELLDIDAEGVMGAFLTCTDPFSEMAYPDAFRVVILCDEQEFLAYVREQRDQEADPSSTRHDYEYLVSALNTLTHEIAHAAEFIAHGHGLTPRQVDSWFDGCFDEESGGGEDSPVSTFDLDIFDVASGRWVREDMCEAQMANNAVACAAMEDRVEAQGYRWIEGCLAQRNTPSGQALRAAIDNCLAWMDEAMAPAPALNTHQATHPRP